MSFTFFKVSNKNLQFAGLDCLVSYPVYQFQSTSPFRRTAFVSQSVVALNLEEAGTQLRGISAERYSIF